MPERTGTPPDIAAIALDDALAQLEFPRALDEVARRAVGPLGAARVRERRPAVDLHAIRIELALVSELRDLLAAGEAFRPEPIEDITPLLVELAMPGTVLDGVALLELGRALEAMRIVRGELGRLTERAPRTAALAVEPPPPALGRELSATFDPDGRVRDGADAGVDRARRRVREVRARLIQTLERTLRGLGAHEASPDASVTVRGGRYVIPVHADARGRVPGLVHAESASGATLFVEPHEAVQLGNELGAAEAEEARAVHALLRRLCETLRPHTDAADAGLEMCVRVDDVYARARYAADVGGHAPGLTEPGGPHALKRACHPLLLAEGVDAVPFDLELETGEHALIVSGPNTGGKTVFLKAVGLISALVQAGVIPPVGDGSLLPVYAAIVTDIGDHQSIAANLSTFSAHLAAVRRALDAAGAGTLVLVDEIGSGTDPAEGAALAASVIQTLVARGGRTIATTHLGALKELAAETPGVVNASLYFDAASLTPTYELVKGVPGRSYGLVIARRLGIPEDVIAAAEARRPDTERSLEAILAEVEQRAQALQAREHDVAVRESLSASREAKLAEARLAADARDAELAARAAELEREGRTQARRYLLEARKKVEEALGVAKAAADEASARQARKLVEDEVAEQGSELARLEAWAGGGKKGARRGERAGRAERAERAERGEGAERAEGEVPPQPSRHMGGGSATDIAPRVGAAEVDLRGMMADEAREATERAVDDAVLADVPVVRIIHGKGTGVLRKVVDEVLRRDRRVRAHHLAPPREGGTGVTVAELGE